MGNFEESARDIWEAYKIVFSSSFVVRKGFQCFGMTQNYDVGWLKKKADIFFQRGQSALEHGANVSFLCDTFSSHYPGFFDQTYQGAQNFSMIWPVTTVALLHDTPEAKIGDICDDGRPEHATKAEKEIELFNQFADLAFSEKDTKEIKDGFLDFQEKTSYNYKALFSLDKFDPILTLIILEGKECKGNMKRKNGGPTSLDKETMRVTDTTNPVDCLTLHLKMIFEYYDIPESITGPIYAVLRVAIMEVRGSFFDWWDRPTPDLGKYI